MTIKTATKKTTLKTTHKKTTTAAKKAAPAARIRVGDRVRWSSSGGDSVGKVVKVVRSSGKIKDFAYHATKDDPRYIVETDEGKHAAHKAEGLHKV